jgi:hypothetical protein
MARFIRDRLDHGGHRRQLVISSALMAIVLAGTGSAALAASGSGKSAANGPLGAVADTYSTADLGTLAVNAGRGVLANDSGAPLQIVATPTPLTDR